jgi:lipopolysaccharide export LptBFGC system permease protein LptF
MKTYWRRYAFPLMAFVFAFIGAAIVISGGASARARNALLALGAVAVYYVLVRVGDFLVLQYAHTAFVAAFGPNLVVLLFGGLWLRRAGRAIG